MKSRALSKLRPPASVVRQHLARAGAVGEGMEKEMASQCRLGWGENQERSVSTRTLSDRRIGHGEVAKAAGSKVLPNALAALDQRAGVEVTQMGPRPRLHALAIDHATCWADFPAFDLP